MSSDAVMGEALRQFRKSIGTKFLLFVLAFGSLALLVRLDEIKLELKKTREKPYQKQAAVAAFAHGSEYLRKASKRISTSGYDSSDALFDALYAKTGLSQARDQQVQATFSRYARAIGDRNTAIENLAVDASPAQKAEQLEHEVVRRDSLIEIRTMEIDRIERESAQLKADLRKEFDEAAVSKHSFDFFQNDAFNRLGQRFADGDDPVSVVFDILWYAALLVGIISIVGLILTPVFRAMPVAGTEERFWEQIKSLLGKAPRVGRGIAGLAAVTVGAVAVMTTAATARSSPWKEAKFTPRRAYLPVVVQQPLPPGPEHPAPPDGRIDKLVADVQTLQATDTGQDHQLADHTKALADHGRTLAAHTTTLAPLIPLPGRVADVERWVGGFDAAENGRLGGAMQGAHARSVAYTDDQIRTVRAAFDLQIEGTHEKIKTVEKDLNTAAQKIDTRADTITNGVFQPYLIGDRPSALKTVFGFDRYRATNATELILRENNADAAIVQAVSWLKQTNKAYTQGDFLRTLRAWTCGDQHVSCDAYVKWHPLVLRTARM